MLDSFRNINLVLGWMTLKENEENIYLTIKNLFCRSFGGLCNMTKSHRIRCNLSALKKRIRLNKQTKGKRKNTPKCNQRENCLERRWKILMLWNCRNLWRVIKFWKDWERKKESEMLENFRFISIFQKFIRLRFLKFLISSFNYWFHRKHNLSSLIIGASNISDTTKAIKNDIAAFPMNIVSYMRKK